MGSDHDQTVTGQDATLKWGDTTFNVTNVSWSRDVSTTEVQHNDRLNPKLMVTGLRYSGSFEYDGRNYDLMNTFLAKLDKPGQGYDRGEPEPGTLSVTERDQSTSPDTLYVYTFKNVLVTSQSRDIPADDSSSTSWDFSAEELHVSETTEKDGGGS